MWLNTWSAGITSLEDFISSHNLRIFVCTCNRRVFNAVTVSSRAPEVVLFVCLASATTALLLVLVLVSSQRCQLQLRPTMC
jgi:hypothetical protein